MTIKEKKDEIFADLLAFKEFQGVSIRKQENSSYIVIMVSEYSDRIRKYKYENCNGIRFDIIIEEVGEIHSL